MRNVLFRPKGSHSHAFDILISPSVWTRDELSYSDTLDWKFGYAFETNLSKLQVTIVIYLVFETKTKYQGRGSRILEQV